MGIKIHLQGVVFTKDIDKVENHVPDVICLFVFQVCGSGSPLMAVCMYLYPLPPFPHSCISLTCV